jgi:hypothetical protein
VEVLGAALKSFNGPMRAFGYKLESQTPDSIVWRRRGLVDVIRGNVDRIAMSLSDDAAGGTVITIAGSGSRRVAKAFDKLTI